MPRHNRRRASEPLPPRTPAIQWRDEWRGEPYVVRSVPGGSAAKQYRCPGCDQLLRGTVAHVVAWPEEDSDAGQRRHWHTSCWQARHRRGPG